MWAPVIAMTAFCPKGAATSMVRREASPSSTPDGGEEALRIQLRLPATGHRSTRSHAAWIGTAHRADGSRPSGA